MRKLMWLLVFCLPTVLIAQDQKAAAREAAGCGPAETQFNVKTDKNQHPMAEPPSDKALIYIFEDEKRDDKVFQLASVTMRVGLDGKWVGANHGRSYFSFVAQPGEHHLCTDWQSSFKRYSRLGSALTVSLEPGKAYFFRVQVEYLPDRPAAVKLEQLDSAQGQFLVSSHALSTAREKEVASN